MVKVDYDFEEKLFKATWNDDIGQLGNPVFGTTREYAVFNLGIKVGSHPEQFSRAMGEYFAKDEA